MRCCILILAGLIGCACNTRDKYNGWSHCKGSPESIHYSSLLQIDTNNVKNLRIAWHYRTGDADTIHNSQIQCNPIIVDTVLYGTSPQMKLFALHAATGNPIWVFNPFDSVDGSRSMFFILNNSRGVAYWQGNAKEKRIFYTAGSFLYCIDAVTGKPVPSFGDTGKIDLHKGLDPDVPDLFVTATSPPIIYKNHLIIGSRVDEGPKAAPGHIRAYDVRTGKRRWIFHTIPYPTEEGYNTWEDPNAHTFIGGANAWSGFSLDEKSGILFAATGSASFDFYGGKRKGDNLFSNCLLALDAATGKRIWHFQHIHHDVWDRDLSSPPALVTIRHDGAKKDAVALTTKTGFIFLFERTTGKALYEITEKPVPAISDAKDEKLSPTQPYPVHPAPFMRQSFTEKDINPLLSTSSYEEVRQRLRSYKNGHMYEPPSLQGTVVFPGLDGGGEWGGPSFDPQTGWLYVNSNEMAWIIQLRDISGEQPASENFQQAGERLYRNNCMSCHGASMQGSGNFPSLAGVDKKYTTQTFNELLQSGRRMMPAFRQLNENEREAIASYVLNLQQSKTKPFIDRQEKDISAVPYTITGYNRFLSKEGYPALAPPWGTLNAIDLNTGEYVWKKTLGHDTAFKNATQPTGTENYGASVVTAGGLLFIGATKDGKFRAFNKRTGELLWETNLPAPAFATPAVYAINGKQYVVIACGGGKLKTKSGDSYVAFALP
ncbi:MAG TPA: PQQ-binding-like beta-propeller repeat protein [Chitinophagaceae bacterium]|nr:PQQ-binding-like beta-propeller repeat protein [Chitinophagaceae bacterium]